MERGSSGLESVLHSFRYPSFSYAVAQICLVLIPKVPSETKIVPGVAFIFPEAEKGEEVTTMVSPPFFLEVQYQTSTCLEHSQMAISNCKEVLEM